MQQTSEIQNLKSEVRVSRKRMTPLRKRIAQQLVSAQHNAAILSTFNECDMSAVMVYSWMVGGEP